MWKATIKGLLAHKFRLALTTLSVVLGVAFISGTYVLTDTMERTFDNLFADTTKGVDVFVRAEASFGGDSLMDRSRVPERLLDDIVAVEGVAHAEGEVTGYAQLVDKQGEAITPQAPTLGVGWPSRPGISALSLRDGRPPQAPNEVAIDAATATTYGFGVGDRIKVLLQGPAEEFVVTGIAGFGDSDNLAGATLAVFEAETAQRVLNAEGEFDAIDVVGAQGVSPEELRDRIANVLPLGVEATTGAIAAAEQSADVKQQLGFFNTALLVFALVALFVGAFIIFNTFNILVTQRTRELALLRALGASGGQVTRSVLAEALMVGVVASAAGLGLGILVAMGLQGLLRAFGIDLPTSELQILTRTVVVAFAVGILITLAASLFPARRAARIPPMAALRDVEAVRPVSLHRRSMVGSAITAVGAVLLLLGLFGGTENALQLVGMGAAVTFLGVAALAPLFARPLARVIGAPLARLVGMPGRLGRDNAMRNPRRTAATSSALMIGLGLVGTFLILGASLKASVGKAVEDTVRADHMLTATSQAVPTFSPMVADELRGQDAVGAVSQIRMGMWRDPDAGASRFLSAVDPRTVEDVLALGVVEGSLRDLSAGEVFVHQQAATDLGVGGGDNLKMDFSATGVKEMMVAGIFTRETMTGSYIVSLETYERNFKEQLDMVVLVDTAAGSSTIQARQAIDGVLEVFPNVRVEDRAEFRERQESQVNQLLGLVSALVGLAILIALLGIVNTLALSVFERTRELGLIRALGMGRGQVRSMIRWEAVIIGLLGGVLGLGVGGFFGWALVRALAGQGVDELAIPAGQLLVFLGLAGLAGVVAAILPARRAARLDVLQAIAYE